jgi:hypothetical protein
MKLLVENLSRSLYSEYRSGEYNVHIHDMQSGLLYLEDLVLTNSITVNELMMSFENITEANVVFFFTAGLYPGLAVSGRGGGLIDYRGEFRLNVFGARIRPFMALRRVSVTDTRIPAIYEAESKQGRFRIDPRSTSTQIIVLGVAPTLVLNFWGLFIVGIALNTGRKLWRVHLREKRSAMSKDLQ